MPSALPKLIIYMPADVKADFEKLAKYERRSLSAMALFAIEQEIRKAKAEGKISDNTDSSPTRVKEED